MNIILNNTPTSIADGTTVATLVNHTTGHTAGVAVAINDHIVRRATWEDTILSEGDAVVIIKAAYGG